MTLQFNSVRHGRTSLLRAYALPVCAAVIALLSGCISANAARTLAPPLSVSIHIDQNAAAISGEVTENENTFRDMTERTAATSYGHVQTLDSKYWAEGTTATYSVRYGTVLTLTVRPFNPATEENPLVITVTEGGTETTYSVYGFEAVRVLRFANDYYID